MAVLYPEKGDFAKVYQALLDLGGDRRQIKTTTDGPSLGLVVPDDLFDRFVGAESTEADEAPKKRPGRPRKSQES